MSFVGAQGSILVLYAPPTQSCAGSNPEYYQILPLQPNKSKQNKETYFLLPSRFVICGGVGNIADLLKCGHLIPIPEPHWGVLSCPGVWSLPRNGAPGECTQEGPTL